MQIPLSSTDSGCRIRCEKLIAGYIYIATIKHGTAGSQHAPHTAPSRCSSLFQKTAQFPATIPRWQECGGSTPPMSSYRSDRDPTVNTTGVAAFEAQVSIRAMEIVLRNRHWKFTRVVEFLRDPCHLPRDCSRDAALDAMFLLVAFIT
jgi:hypothetical protein